MLNNLRHFFALLCLVTVFAVQADGVKSFSKQMNDLKRSGNYVYAESSAPNEADAKAACDALLKIEITKYLISADPKSDGRILKDISRYNREYLVQPRGDMIRVFGFVPKKDIVSAPINEADRNTGKSQEVPETQSDAISQEKEPQPEAVPTAAKQTVKEAIPTEAEKEEPAEEIADKVADPASEQPNTTATGSPITQPEEATPTVEAVPSSTAPAETPSLNEGLHTDGLQLAKWQTDMLESVVKEPDMAQAKRLLNRYRNQNRVKRSGDATTANTRPNDSFYLICDNSGKPVALLAPSASKEHYDMLSGTTANIDNYSGNPFLWFQISK